jgi:hypothetical protein
VTCSTKIKRAHCCAFMTTLSRFTALLTVTCKSTIYRECFVTFSKQQQLHYRATMLCIHCQTCCVVLFVKYSRIYVLNFSNNVTLVTSIFPLIFRTTVYIEHMTAWYDLKTHNEVINLKFFSKITKSVGTAGLTGLDRLFSFMIVTELQVCFMNSCMFHFTC